MIKLIVVWTTLMCMDNRTLEGPYRTYAIEHNYQITYFKLHCPSEEYKLVTEGSNGITVIKEFPNETKDKDMAGQDARDKVPGSKDSNPSN